MSQRYCQLGVYPKQLALSIVPLLAPQSQKSEAKGVFMLRMAAISMLGPFGALKSLLSRT